MLLSKIIMIYGPQKLIGKRAYCASTFITKIDLETIDNIDQINILIHIGYKHERNIPPHLLL